MKRMFCIIPPDEAIDNELYKYKLSGYEFHDTLLLNYCSERNLDFNDIISCTLNSYVYISSLGNSYVCFIPELTDKQEEKLLRFFEEEYNDNPKIEINIGLVNKNKEF